jgi:transcriptional regulator with XRE-family HTH domain
MKLRVYNQALDSPATGRNIRKRRIKVGMKAVELARAIGRSKTYVSRIESGERIIKPKMIKLIEKALQ